MVLAQLHPPAVEFPCPLCSCVATSGEWAGQVGASRGHVKIAWSYIPSAACRTCLKQFGERERLLAHLKSDGSLVLLQDETKSMCEGAPETGHETLAELL